MPDMAARKTRWHKSSWQKLTFGVSRRTGCMEDLATWYMVARKTRWNTNWPSRLANTYAQKMLGWGRCADSRSSGLVLDSTKNMAADRMPISVACTHL